MKKRIIIEIFVAIIIVVLVEIAGFYIFSAIFIPDYYEFDDINQRERAYIDTFRIDDAGITIVAQKSKSKTRIFFGDSDSVYSDYFDFKTISEYYDISVHFIPPDSIYIIDLHNVVSNFTKWRYKLRRVVAGDSTLGFVDGDRNVPCQLPFLIDSTSFFRPHYTITVHDNSRTPIRVWCSHNDSLIYDSDTVKLNTVKGYYYIHHNKTVLDSI